MQNGNYSKLNDEGFMPPGTTIDPGDAIIGKIMVTNALGKRDRKETVQRDRSVLLYPNEPTVLDKVLVTLNKDGDKIYKCRTRATRIPQTGDKFSSTCGQKGTIGAIFNQEDMPFNEMGITPDCVINPHAIPSRMTIGLLLEMLLGKAACLEGQIGNGTAFRNITAQNIGEVLVQHGYQSKGHEVMYDGRTGAMLKGTVFMGVAYYQRLKHMVVEKVHARNQGPVQILTRQPVEGRSRNGGLRFGEMERDTGIAHGASRFLQDRLCFSSDAFTLFVCNTCGMLAQNPQPEKKHEIFVGMLKDGPYCQNCLSHENIQKTIVPYAFKLLKQELEACHFGMRLRVK
jgi:DNA-directed RNA polymerase II subunit RPB2